MPRQAVPVGSAEPFKGVCGNGSVKYSSPFTARVQV